MLKSSANSSFKGYEKVKKIGQGTYANVYLGLGKQLKGQDLQIAIKSIKQGLFTNGIDLSAVREIKYLKEIKHPNVISLMDVVMVNGNSDVPTSLNLILEFLDADLEMVIKNRNCVFSNADIKSWMMMMLRGVNYIHLHNILHRVYDY